MSKEAVKAIVTRVLEQPNIARYFQRGIYYSPSVCEVLWYDLADAVVREVRSAMDCDVPAELRGLVSTSGCKARVAQLIPYPTEPSSGDWIL